MLACALIGVILGGTGAVVAFAVDDNSTVQLPNFPGSSDHPVLPSNLPSLPDLPSGVKLPSTLPTIPHSFANRPSAVPTR
jgi:hypothetical protein